MNLMARTDALFYPFHLCHERTLQHLLAQFSRVHFRDYMALQLTPLFGTTAYPDRMGDSFPHLVSTGRLLQGYSVSGPLSQEAIIAVDRDMSDPTWRALFHTALTQDRRVQRGLFDGPPPAHLMDDRFRAVAYSVARIQQLSRQRLAGEDTDRFDYGLALLKTSASLVYTVQLATAHQFAVATDSASHCALLARTIERDAIALENHRIERSGY